MDKMKRWIAYEKVSVVINSCETQQQLIIADNMIDNFKNMYGSFNIWANELDSLYLEKNEELAYTPTNEFQPCGKAHQQPGNADYQAEMLEQCRKDEEDRFKAHWGGH